MKSMNDIWLDLKDVRYWDELGEDKYNLIIAISVLVCRIPKDVIDNTFKYHVFAPMGRFQLELIYLYFPPSFHLTVVVSVLTTAVRWKDGGK